METEAERCKYNHYVCKAKENIMETTNKHTPRLAFAPYKCTLRNILLLECAHTVAVRKTNEAQAVSFQRNAAKLFIFAN